MESLERGRRVAETYTYKEKHKQLKFIFCHQPVTVAFFMHDEVSEAQETELFCGEIGGKIRNSNRDKLSLCFRQSSNQKILSSEF
jgi:hypothetical protein